VQLRVRCPECQHEVSLPAGDVMAHADRDLSAGVFAYHCPRSACRQPIRERVGAAGLEMMIRGGVKPHLHAPGEPLSRVDLSVFLRALDGTDDSVGDLVDGLR
jgi:hypothetical protein